MSAVFQMSYGALQPPTDLFGVNSALRSRAYPLSSEHRTDSDSHSPMSEPRSPLFRPSLTAEFPPHLASLYNSPYAAAAVAAAVAGQGSGAVGASPTFNLYGRAPSAAAFYPGMIAGEAWRRAPYLSQLDFCWPPGLRSLEAVVGPRTKAPREATSILKSWLNEHKDNPYPTKSEKMTLSLVTHMTLTQVSTWFANARRRIKKENKMTWTPKTRCGERDGSSSNEDESEKDYFGRQRSPFAMTRDMGSDGPVYRTSGEYDERKRQLSFDGAATSSSRPFSTDIPRKPPSHPLFAAFSGLQSPYGSLNPASLEDAFRRRLLSKQTDSTLESKGSEFPTEEKKSEHKNSEDKRDTIRSPPALLARVFQREVNSAKTATTTVTEQGGPHRTEIRMPFVHLQQNRNPSANDDDKDDHDEEKQEEIQDEPADVVTKHDVDDASGPFPVPSKSEGNASTPGQAPSYKVDKESERPKSVEEQQFVQQKQLPSLYRPFHMAGDVMAKSASNGTVDALSCWIRDFQKLVSSGQEFKAKQALAAALTVAAKAGAYSGMGGTQRPAPYFNPHRLNAEGRLSSDRSREDATRRHRRPSPPLSNRTFRFSAMDISEHENKSREDDVKTLSPEMPLRRSTSPDTPPANAVRLRSPYKGPIGARDDAPMNLSKLPPTKDWSDASMATDDGRIEA